MPWKIEGQKVDLKKLTSALQANAKIKIEKRFGKEYLRITCNVPSDISINMPYLDASLEKNQLVDKNGQSIKLTEQIDVGSGGGSSSKKVNGKMQMQQYTFVTFSSEIDNKTQYQQPIKGSITLKTVYKDNFATAKISKDEIGKTVNFDGNTVRVISVEGNKAVYDIEELSASDYNTMNTKDGVQLGLNFERRDELKLGFSTPTETATR